MKNVLVIDDEFSFYSLIKDVLDDLDMQCHHMQDAVDLKNNDFSSIDIIVLDLLMPNTDGIEVLRNLSAMKINSGIILTSGIDSRVLNSAKLLANELGLNVLGILPKPFRAAELKDLANTHTNKVSDLKQKNEIKETTFSKEDIQAGLRNNEFSVVFQPKIDIQKSQLSGCEALLRWNSSKHGFVSPVDFIPVAEQNGMISELTDFVITQSLTHSKNLASCGIDITISINAPVALINDITFVDYITDKVTSANVSTENIIVELTESEVVSELVSNLDVLTRLRMKGFALSIDDFGTGYSNLERLANMPFNELKIDRSFIIDIANQSEQSIIKHSIELAQNFSMKVVAEGVEDFDTVVKLKAMGCDVVQGYYFSKPLTDSDFISWAINYIDHEYSQINL